MDRDKNIIRLYENFIDEIYEMSTSKLKLSKQILQEETKLIESLTDEQKEILNKINKYEDIKNELVNRNTFVFAYKLANNLIIESLSKNEQISNT